MVSQPGQLDNQIIQPAYPNLSHGGSSLGKLSEGPMLGHWNMKASEKVCNCKLHGIYLMHTVQTIVINVDISEPPEKIAKFLGQ